MIVCALVEVGPPRYLTFVSSGKAPNHSYTFPPKVKGMNVLRSFPSIRVTPWYISKDFTHSLITSSVSLHSQYLGQFLHWSMDMHVLGVERDVFHRLALCMLAHDDVYIVMLLLHHY